LGDILNRLPKIDDPNVLVGFNTADDAGVIKLTDDLALIQTVDVFTPVVDDPYTYGAIAAANSLSDVYAMGGKPVSALNIMGFPQGKFDLSVMAEILTGAHDKAKEAGISIVGGHTIRDNELKFGLSVSGIVHPSKIMTNAAARPGDRLFLTKPLGSGVISTAIRAGKITDSEAGQCIELMMKLNRASAEAMVLAEADAVTDVTGFGMLGHLWEMVAGSKIGARVIADEVPMMEMTFKFIEMGTVPAGSHGNKAFLEDKVIYGESISEQMKIALSDAQTSGGLLIAVPPEKVDRFLSEMEKRGELDYAVEIGEFISDHPGKIDVL